MLLLVMLGFEGGYGRGLDSGNLRDGKGVLGIQGVFLVAAAADIAGVLGRVS